MAKKSNAGLIVKLRKQRARSEKFLAFLAANPERFMAADLERSTKGLIADIDLLIAHWEAADAKGS